MQGIKFFEGEQRDSLAYDDIGKTAMEAVENNIYDEENESYKFV